MIDYTYIVAILRVFLAEKTQPIMKEREFTLRRHSIIEC